MNLVEQVKEDAQMLFDKRDVLKLLEKQKAEDIEKACSFLSQHLRSTEYQGHPNNDTFLKSWFMACIKQAMKGE